jgi:hypothetical protein
MLFVVFVPEGLVTSIRRLALYLFATRTKHHEVGIVTDAKKSTEHP